MRRFFLKTIGLLFLVALIVGGFNVGKTAFYKQKYPLKYKNEIEIYAKEYSLDPYLVASVIWVESKYDPLAVSGVGASGLMQIMPETGGWIASKLDDEGFSPDELFEPETNIVYGCWYLNYLNSRFSSDQTKVLAAYNGGPNRVAEWMDDAAYAENGDLINIPITETANYVERVKNTYEIYSEYYTFYDEN